MKKLGKSTKKGFTLVELIVVLVILAVLAAMLVPALVGYIDRARAEKEYQTAATVYGAAQAVITEKYAKDTTLVTGDTDLEKTTATYGAQVLKLAGVSDTAVSAFKFTYGKDYIIKSGSVTISGYKYELTIDATTGAPSWSSSKVTT
jgi:type IV pilus assembly protein PilA